jgi:ATP-binding cassette subfamily F protein 3
MRQALTMALQSFEGAMVLVSHDRHLLRNTVDTFWRVADGTVTEFDGDLDEYERWLSDPRRKETAAPAQEVPGNSGQAQQGRQNRKKAGAERRQKLAPYRKEAKRHEQALERINAEKAEVEKALGDSSLYEEARKDELRKLLARQAELEQKEESAEQAWLEANEAIEAIEAGDD